MGLKTWVIADLMVNWLKTTQSNNKHQKYKKTEKRKQDPLMLQVHSKIKSSNTNNLKRVIVVMIFITVKSFKHNLLAETKRSLMT